MKYIRWFQEISLADIASVGGKNASLGEMTRQLLKQGISVPQGFAVTADAYWQYLDHNQLRTPIKDILDHLDYQNETQLHECAASIRALIDQGSIPSDIKHELEQAYQELSAFYQIDACDVAVRSSATAEDLPGASFAGQQETYLNVLGSDQLFRAYVQCLASLFTDRAIVYRQVKHFDHFSVGLSVGIQKMVRSDSGCSGVAFSLDPETGFRDVVVINSSYGLGESIVQGLVTPDEFVVYKPMLDRGYNPIIKKQRGSKKTALVYGETPNSIVTVDVPDDRAMRWCLADTQIVELARMVVTIEQYYSTQAGHPVPMDIEWALDGIDGTLYIIQARPETVHAAALDGMLTMTQYQIRSDQGLSPLLMGNSIGQQVVSGTVRIIHAVSEIAQVQPGDILVTRMTDPDWVPAMRKVAGIITELGGRTCHAAIVSREMHIPAIVGAVGATEQLRNGQRITLDCSQGLVGRIYDGALSFDVIEQKLDELPQAPVALMINIADPERAFSLAKLPVAGVGLARIEFIIAGTIKIHPCALLYPDKVDQATRDTVHQLVSQYNSPSDYFIELLAQGIAQIAAAFYPRPVTVRCSDFKTNEYRNLIGGTFFEPIEENPMLGLRGASRYYHPEYRQAFELECRALHMVREQMGFENVEIMVPFVRTVQEAHQVIDVLAANNIVRGRQGLRLIMMCELPSNVLCMEEFSAYFDGFSIGSNDLTQTTLGVDRDSGQLSGIFDERDEAVKRMMVLAITRARAASKSIGICGQAPSDYPEVADFLIKQGITSLSLNPDSVIPFLLRYNP